MVERLTVEVYTRNKLVAGSIPAAGTCIFFCEGGRSRPQLHSCEEYTPSTLDTYPFPNPYQHVNTVTMSELIITSSAYIINGDSPMTSVANTVAMTTLAVHTLQPLIFYTGYREISDSQRQ